MALNLVGAVGFGVELDMLPCMALMAKPWWLMTMQELRT